MRADADGGPRRSWFVRLRPRLIWTGHLQLLAARTGGRSLRFVPARGLDSWACLPGFGLASGPRPTLVLPMGLMLVGLVLHGM